MELAALKAKLDILETKTDSLESSFSNTSCTVSGVTNDWYKRYDTIEVEGKSKLQRIMNSNMSAKLMFLVDDYDRFCEILSISNAFELLRFFCQINQYEH